MRSRSGAACIAAIGLMLFSRAAEAQPIPPDALRITVVDGQVLFQGGNFDVAELRAALAKTGRQNETLYFKVGPNAKSAYLGQVLRAVKEAGFSKLSILGPTGDSPVMTFDPSQIFD